MSAARAKKPAKKPTKKAANPDRQIEIFITRKAAAHIVRLEEDLLLEEIRNVERRHFSMFEYPNAVRDRLDGLRGFLLRLRDVRSRLEQLGTVL
jgi:hypothetical protein